jgi:hypothetical protein
MKLVSIKLVLGSIVLLMLAACVAPGGGDKSRHVYEGPKRQRSELAVVFTQYGTFQPGQLHSYIARVDGKMVAAIYGAPDEVLLLPGNHQLGMVTATGFTTSNYVVELDGLAGHTYELLYRYSDSARTKVSYAVLDRGINFVRPPHLTP